MESRAIDKALKASGSQKKLADAVGVSKQLVNAWKKRDIPLRRIPEVAAATGIPVADLLPESFKVKG